MKTQYIIITPVHNEEDLMEQVIESVIAQTVLPDKWLIVDDDSTDGTRAVIDKYIDGYDFIEYFHLQRSDIKTYYSRRINVILASVKHIQNANYDFIAFLDADLTMEPTYYENILSEFDRNPELGIASGIYENCIDGKLHKVVRDKENISTPGGLQVFRRECYDAIGGHVPLPYGGSDALMGILARMKGWTTRCFPEYKTIHYRPIGVRFGKGALRVKFKQGMQEYDLGTNPMFMVAKSLRRNFNEMPYFFAGLFRLLGFLYLLFKRQKRMISTETIKYVQREQLGRLSATFSRMLRFRSAEKVTTSSTIKKKRPTLKEYVLVTAAYNEDNYIEALIKSVVSQTILPKKWIIVDNGSTDKTEQIIKKYSAQHDFIVYYHHRRSNTGSYYYHKIEAFLGAAEKIRDIEYDFIASLDADLTLESTYYEDILREFEININLGIASGVYLNNVNGKIQRVSRSLTSTPGGLQVFRRDCYEDIGGYAMLSWGGEDAFADIMAQMKGWQTRSFSQYKAMHYRFLGVRGSTNTMKAIIVQGRAEYDIGSHIIFICAKSFCRGFIEKPFLLSGVLRLFGFLQCYVKNEKKAASEEVIKFIQKKQMKRLLFFDFKRE